MKNINELKEQVQKGKLFNYTFFWGHRQKKEGTVDKSYFNSSPSSSLWDDYWRNNNKIKLF